MSIFIAKIYILLYMHKTNYRIMLQNVLHLNLHTLKYKMYKLYEQVTT